MNLHSHLAAYALALLDASPDWSPEETTAEDAHSCVFDRHCADLDFDFSGETDFEIVDLEPKATRVTYANGKRKRKRYRWSPVDLSKLQVLIVLHQTGVERSEATTSKRGHLVTCHRLIGPTGVRYRVHPLDCRLVAANRLDRSPWHAISIEVGGNFEGTDGDGDWYKPERFGRGRAGNAQLAACRLEVAEIIDEVEAMGGQVVGIAPHRISGRNRKGRPNRPLCCGSRVWAHVGEHAGAVQGLRVPAPEFSVGGLVVPDEWHGEHWGACRRLLAV